MILCRSHRTHKRTTNPIRTMPAKTKAAPKKPAPKKKPAPVPPIIIVGKTVDVFASSTVAGFLSTIPSSRLKELLRARGISIPKDKDRMIDRLTDHVLLQGGGTFALSLY